MKDIDLKISLITVCQRDTYLLSYHLNILKMWDIKQKDSIKIQDTSIYKNTDPSLK